MIAISKKRNSIKPFKGKVGLRHVTKISDSCPVLDGDLAITTKYENVE